MSYKCPQCNSQYDFKSDLLPQYRCPYCQEVYLVASVETRLYTEWQRFVECTSLDISHLHPNAEYATDASWEVNIKRAEY